MKNNMNLIDSEISGQWRKCNAYSRLALRRMEGVHMEGLNKGAFALISGLALVAMNLFVLAPYVAEQVEAGVQDVVADGYDEYYDYEEDLDHDGNLDVFEDLDGDGNITTEDLDGDCKLDVDEDANGDGILDLGEDLDFDGILDVDEDADGDGQFDNEDVDCDGKLDLVDEDYDGDGMLLTDWTNVTSERTYFAYSITDQDALSSDDPSQAFEKMGPFIYEVTTKREVHDFDADAGTITYSEYDSFEWCEDCTWTDSEGKSHDSVSGDTNITNVNILWNTQRMAGLATGITYGEIFAKAGFAQQMLINDLQNKAPSIFTSSDIRTSANEAVSILASEGAGADSFKLGRSSILDGFYDSWNASSDAGVSDPNFTAEAPTVGQCSDSPVIASGACVRDADADGQPDSFTYAAANIMYNAKVGIDNDGDGTYEDSVCIALTCDWGPSFVAAWGAPSETVTPVRAALLGYGTTDPTEMAMMDWAIYASVATMFQANGGGAIINESTPDLRERLHAVSGTYIDSPTVLDSLLFGTEGSSPNNGLLSVSDFQGIPLYGVALFLLGAQGDILGTMETYGIDALALQSLAFNWAGPWIGLVGTPLEFPMILLGASGTMDAQRWWEISFGSAEPISGATGVTDYIVVGLNRGDYEGTVSLSTEKVREILYTSEYALTGDFASLFIYGEFSGVTLPTGPEGPVMGGTESEWNDAYVADLYGLSDNEAAALRSWVKDFMFEQVVGALLSFQYDASELTTQPVNNWLYGWSDSVLVGLFGAENSWVSLETNETYFGSGGMSTGDFSVYVMSTGTGLQDRSTTGHRLFQGYINSDGDGYCDIKLDSNGSLAEPVNEDADGDGKLDADEDSNGNGELDDGEDIDGDGVLDVNEDLDDDGRLDVDGDGLYSCAENEIYALTEHLPWRAPYNEEAAYGLLSNNVGNNKTVVAGTIGGIADADASFRVNLVGYAITESTVGSKVDYKGIEMTEHTVDLDPSKNQIQAKLIGSGTYVDILPGALPVYFGSHVDIKVEPVTNVAMYGKSVSRFYFDLRGPGSTNPDFSENSTDTHPVFEIHTFSEIGDDDAATFKGKVLDNMDPFYWTDFGGSGDTELEGTSTIDFVTLFLYLGGLLLVAYGGRDLLSE